MGVEPLIVSGLRFTSLGRIHAALRIKPSMSRCRPLSSSVSFLRSLSSPLKRNFQKMTTQKGAIFSALTPFSALFAQ